MFNQNLLSHYNLFIRPVLSKFAKLPAVKNCQRRSGFGLNEVIGIAITVTVAALVIAPGIRTFAGAVLTSMNTWFTAISAELFKTT